MISAILYTSNTGSAERYAKMAGEMTGLPVYPLAQAPIPAGSEILYIGWVMAGSIKGYKKAGSKYQIKAVCGVCMGATGSQIQELRKQNAIWDAVPLFTLQGGFDMEKLHGIYRFMMKMMKNIAGKALLEKKERTKEEEDMLSMLYHGADRVSKENLKEVVDWFFAQK